MKDTIYMRKQFPVRGRTITAENMHEVAEWCGGQVNQKEGQSYIWVPAENARQRSQTEAHIGDTILKSRREDKRRGGNRYIFKVYRPEWLAKEFDAMNPEDVAFLLGEEEEEPDRVPAPREAPRSSGAVLRAVR
jgi:hypothetical protein